MKNTDFIINDKLNINKLIELTKKPEIFTLGDELFWDDPHISKQMLEAHLEPDWEAASKKHETIDKEVDWLVNCLNLKKEYKILDLGCGPGLYCTRFSDYQLNVTGIDYSRNSINYAKGYAKENDLNIRYIYQNYLTIDFEEEFDAIFLIYCDFGVLNDEERGQLLSRIHKALKPGGYFVFDVFTKNNRSKDELDRFWSVNDKGFWKENPYIALAETFSYLEQDTYLDQTITFEEDGKISIYRIWERHYTKDKIGSVLGEYGFYVEEFLSNLMGEPFSDKSKKLGIVSRKK